MIGSLYKRLMLNCLRKTHPFTDHQGSNSLSQHAYMSSAPQMPSNYPCIMLIDSSTYPGKGRTTKASAGQYRTTQETHGTSKGFDLIKNAAHELCMELTGSIVVGGGPFAGSFEIVGTGVCSFATGRVSWKKNERNGPTNSVIKPNTNKCCLPKQLRRSRLCRRCVDARGQS